MLQIGVQTKNIVQDKNPEQGFQLLSEAGFSAADFSLNRYLLNTNIYQSEINHFFDASIGNWSVSFCRKERQRKKLVYASTRCICHIRRMSHRRMR